MSPRAKRIAIAVVAVAIFAFLYVQEQNERNERRAQAAETSAFERARDDTRATASTLGKEIATYWVDGNGPVTVEDIDGEYFVGGLPVGSAPDNVALAPFDALTQGGNSVSWCVEVQHELYPELHYSYDAQQGLTDAHC